MTRKHPKVLVLAAALVPAIVLGGSLEPPGPPAPTMKPLSQIEPRIPIHAANLPMTISSPGSYYLAENITAPAGGITIESDSVTLDLMGFTLGEGPGSGITVPQARKNIALLNGTVSGWASHGVDALNATESLAKTLRVTSNGGDGLRLGGGSLVTECVAGSNGGTGIRAGIPNNPPGVWGVGATVSNCSAYYNAGTGIVAGTGSLVTGCSLRYNSGHGIELNSNGHVSNCSVSTSGLNGIEVAGAGYVFNNRSFANTGAGIRVLGYGSQIDSNMVGSNDIGLRIEGAGNNFIRNAAGAGNSTDYSIAPGNLGEIVNNPVSSNAYANMRF